MNFCHLKIIRFLHPHYHTKITDILKNVQKNKCVYVNEVIMINDSEREAENKRYITQIRHK